MSVARVAAAFARGDLEFIDRDALAAWIVRQRWFATKASEVVQVSVREALPLADALALAILEVRLPSGTHDLYQVPVGLRAAGDGSDGEAICEADGWQVYDALSDPVHALTIARLLSESAVVDLPAGRLEFHALARADGLGAPKLVRSMPGEQSNTSLVYDERTMLKVFRRLGAGTNPELEMLRFLTQRGFANVAELLGWYEHRGELIEATLGIAERYVAEARSGWELTLDALAGGEGLAWLPRLAELGTMIGEMHTLLASDPSDPDFASEEQGPEAMSLLAATIDERVERVFVELPDSPALEPIAGRGEEVREHVRKVARGSGGGRLIRQHGDLHLGQTMLAPRGWVIVDFEGEPARSLIERRLRRSPLRDVASMLRSFSYAAAAAELQRGVRPPADWEERARGAFLDTYLERTDSVLLPPDRATREQMLALFELEKAIYELRYELDHRPDWVAIPVAAIQRLLEVLAA